MKPKYRLTGEENIFVAKRNIVDYIFKSAKLEGLGVTYPDTEAIYNGMSVAGVPVNDIIAVNNLKRAWQFLLDTLDVPADYAYICKLNQIVGGDGLIINAGFLRTMPVSIGGTTWKPELPIESVVKETLAELERIESPTERGIMMMLTLMRQQIFYDGNKRTAMLAGNQIMIANGCGVLSVPLEHLRRFTELLVAYYESDDPETLAAFVYDNCIDGIALEKDRNHKPHSDLER